MNKRLFILILLITALTLTACTDFIATIPSSRYTDTQESIVSSDDTVQFHFIDVGQGDCILIKNGDRNILVDSGTEESSSTVYRYLSSLGIKYLDYFIGTHPHDDHMGGVHNIINSIDVGCIFLNHDTSNSYSYEKFVDIVLEREIQTRFPNMDAFYELGGLKIKFLSPREYYEDENHNSLVFTVAYKDVTALFMGDAEKPVETDLIKSGANIKADILKVGHHGSRNASSLDFLKEVNPSVSVIQCGKDNSYGHPHKETVERLKSIGCETLRTDEEGTIVLSTDGTDIKRVSGESYNIDKNNNEEVTISYIGNAKSKVYHTLSCPNLPSEKNRIDFATKENAINSGYKPCGNCNP